MTQLLADMLPAAMLGLFIAMPFGPICLMCVQRTLALGISFGIASGMGAAVAHGTFSFLAEASAAMLAQTALTVQVPLYIAGGLALMVMGLRTCLVPSARRAQQGVETCAPPLCRRYWSLPPTR
jgi:threonine/homoserine/homoserine lactone efflux protein